MSMWNKPLTKQQATKLLDLLEQFFKKQYYFVCRADKTTLLMSQYRVIRDENGKWQNRIWIQVRSYNAFYIGIDMELSKEYYFVDVGGQGLTDAVRNNFVKVCDNFDKTLRQNKNPPLHYENKGGAKAEHKIMKRGKPKK